MSLLRPGVRVHLIGIGGIGLSAIARVLHGWGYAVSGSDQQPTALTAELHAEGLTIYAGHRAEHVGDAGLVIVSSAVPGDNPEVIEARRRGIPVVTRETFLAELTAGKTTIAVAGTHGKTTTSAMIAWVLLAAGRDPSFVVGGVLQNLGTNARAGRGPHFVIEADEYDRAFLGLHPDVAVITALEHDHPDCYPTFDELQAAFAQFIQQVSEERRIIVCGEDAAARRLVEQTAGSQQTISYGIGPGWEWQARDVELTGRATFELRRGEDKLGTCALQLPGRHNVLNALAALAACVELGVEPGEAMSALARFQGTARRFEIKGQAAGVVVIDDYAHHPTEIRATLAAARTRYAERPIWAVFQPHTYSRTAALLGEFADAFGDADHVLVTGIYAAREPDTLGISGADVVARSDHADARYVETLDEAVAALLERVQPGDVVLTLGAGDGYLIGERLLASLNNREEAT